MPKWETREERAWEFRATAWRAKRSRSIKGRECGGVESRVETVDLPEAIPPVRPTTEE